MILLSGLLVLYTGIYIMQNTMVGEENGHCEKKVYLGGKEENVLRKTEENYIKNSLKMHLFEL